MYGPGDKRFLHLADGTKIAAGGLGIPDRPGGSVAAARALGAHRRHGHAVQRHDRAARLVRFSRRGLVPGRVQHHGSRGPSVTRRNSQGCMADWRRQFAAPLPFLVVQLANYGPMAKAPVESGWALTRDAQRRAVAADGNAGTGGDHRHRQSRRRASRPTSRKSGDAWRAPRATRCSATRSRPRARNRSRRCARRWRVQVTFGDLDWLARGPQLARSLGLRAVWRRGRLLPIRARASDATTACCWTRARSKPRRACASAGRTARCAISMTPPACPSAPSKSRSNNHE